MPSVPDQAFETSFSHPLPQSLEVTEARARGAEVEKDPHVRPWGGVQLYISDSRVAIPSQTLSQD